MSNLVCPECGNETFAQVRTTRTRFVMEFDESAGWFEVEESCEDCGDMADSEIACDDCGNTVYESELITREAYADAEGEYAL